MRDHPCFIQVSVIHQTSLCRAEYLEVLPRAMFQLPYAVLPFGAGRLVVIRLILMADCRADRCDRSYVGSSSHNLLLYEALARKPSRPTPLYTSYHSHSFHTYCTTNSLSFCIAASKRRNEWFLCVVLGYSYAL